MIMMTQQETVTLGSSGSLPELVIIRDQYQNFEDMVKRSDPTPLITVWIRGLTPDTADFATFRFEKSHGTMCVIPLATTSTKVSA